MVRDDFAENDETERAKDEGAEGQRREMMLTGMSRRVSSDATFDGGAGIPERLPRDHPMDRPLDGVFPLPEAVVALTLRQSRYVSVHRRSFFVVRVGPNVQG